MAKKKKVRVDLKKNRSKPPRERQWTRGFHEHGFEEEATTGGERVARRHGLLTRQSRGREHVLVANVDQMVIVMSLVEPDLKPHLIDRYLASAEQGGIAPLVCLNKADLVDGVLCQPLIGMYSQL